MHGAQQKLLSEMDLRYQQRYDAQIKALDAALLAAEKAVQTALTAAEKAVNKAETAAEKRFEAVNEFRAALSDQAATLMPRTEAEARYQSNADKIADLITRLDKMEARSRGISAGWGYLIAAGTLMIGLIGAAVTIYLAVRK
jgi:hypothetical protein